MNPLRKVFMVVAAWCLPFVANAQIITYTDLQPLGSGSTDKSFGTGTSGSVQTGYGYFGGALQHAVAWSGSAASFVDLNPPGSLFSVAYGASGNQQVGSAFLNSQLRAGYWSGTAASFVNLNPPSASTSEAFAISGNYQAGKAYVNGGWHAVRWTGTAASFVDLNPAGVVSSVAYATSGGKQAGDISAGDNRYHAAFWSGTAASCVDLNPAGATSSTALAVTDSLQGGGASFGEQLMHAGIWSGTAASFIDLNPTGSIASRVTAMTGNLQAGFAGMGSPGSAHNHAGIWLGSADSFIDLHLVLGSAFEHSEANAIWTDGSVIKVVGQGYSGGNSIHALLWTITSVPEPSSGAMLCAYLALAIVFRRRMPL